MRQVVGDHIVESWSIELTPVAAPSICLAIERGDRVTPAELMKRHDGSGELVHAIPLLLQSGKQRSLVPGLDTPLAVEDRILFCGRARAREIMRYGLVAPQLPRWRRHPSVKSADSATA